MISFQVAYQKCQYLSGDMNPTALIQFKQDINVGYHRFDAAISRYFTRKQQFTDLVQGQKYYQTPVDAVRVIEVSTIVSQGFEYPVAQIRSESDWRTMNMVPNYSGSYALAYFVYGNDQIGLYPIPSQNVTNGLRYVYQPQDVDLTQDDYTTGTATISNGAVAVTGSGTSWTPNMVGRQFQITNGNDGNWYEIEAVANSTALTLKTPFVGISTSGGTYQISQVFIFPGEYDDVPCDYALGRFFEMRNNPSRAQYHFDKFEAAVADAVRRYASSSTSQIITDYDTGVYPPSVWNWPPMPGN